MTFTLMIQGSIVMGPWRVPLEYRSLVEAKKEIPKLLESDPAVRDAMAAHLFNDTDTCVVSWSLKRITIVTERPPSG